MHNAPTLVHLNMKLSQSVIRFIISKYSRKCPFRQTFFQEPVSYFLLTVISSHSKTNANSIPLMVSLRQYFAFYFSIIKWAL